MVKSLISILYHTILTFDDVTKMHLENIVGKGEKVLRLIPKYFFKLFQNLLASHHDEFARQARQERTCVFQDYALLAAKVLENIGK